MFKEDSRFVRFHYLSILLGAVAGVVLLASALPSEAFADSKPRLRVLTKNQSHLLNSGELRVRIKARPGRLRARAVHAGSTKYFAPARKKLSNRGRRLIRIKLLPRGRAKLSRCGSHRVRVVVVHRSSGRKLRISKTKRL
ncbi:MAG: hypothetical protein M3Y23_00240, partial [Actinomycetota bacterium]|nr:hypothetical protein [Actinomycetota bacterium]